MPVAIAIAAGRFEPGAAGRSEELFNEFDVDLGSGWSAGTGWLCALGGIGREGLPPDCLAKCLCQHEMEVEDGAGRERGLLVALEQARVEALQVEWTHRFEPHVCEMGSAWRRMRVS